MAAPTKRTAAFNARCDKIAELLTQKGAMTTSEIAADLHLDTVTAYGALERMLADRRVQKGRSKVRVEGGFKRSNTVRWRIRPPEATS